MNRRDMLLKSGAAVALSAFPLHWAAASDKTADKKKQKVLYFTRSAGFKHSVVSRKGSELAHSEKIVTELGGKGGFEVVCSQEEDIFDGDLSQYDLFAFYTTGKVISEERKKKLLDAIHGGKGFVGFHCATDTFHAGTIDPYIAMIGGEFIVHGAQQKSTMKVVSPDFPGLKGIGDSFTLMEEWYSLKRFASNLHVILLQETAGMKGDMYHRDPYPATWARMHGKGRVFYTSMGHREDVWTNPIFQQIVSGGFSWALGNVEADVTPNLDKVAPKANLFAPEKKA
jgi:type 1 glutamine amidotransferase